MSYYKILIEYYQTDKRDDFIKYFNQWRKEGLLNQREIEKLKALIPDVIDELGELIDQKDPDFILLLYREVKEKNDWNDDELCENLRISLEDIKKIKNRQVIKKRIVDKIFYKWSRRLIEKNQ